MRFHGVSLDFIVLSDETHNVVNYKLEVCMDTKFGD